MVVSLIRSVILYFVVVILYRVMGKRQIGEMQPSELVLAIMISDIASVPMQSVATPLVSGIVPIVVLMCVEVVLAFIAQKSNRLRKIITGQPSLVIADGKILTGEMERLRFNLDDLFEQLRNSGQFDISQVAFAVLETNGNLSVMPKEPYRPLVVQDMRKETAKATFPSNIIKDGTVDYNALAEIGKDESWLQRELQKRNIRSSKKVFLLCADRFGVTFLQKKGE